VTVSDKRSAAGDRAPWGGRGSGLAVRDAPALVFAADMYGVQLDQLAVLTGSDKAARAAAARWRSVGYAQTGRLGPGAQWLWATRAGLAACGLKYTAVPPALSRLAHIRAVGAVRLALEATTAYREANAFWRSERRIRLRHGIGVREHLPDAEVHWPDDAPVAWAGECWAVEAELTRKTVARTVAIMREILARTGDYGCPAAEAVVPGRSPRHARALYLCSPAALATVLRARAELGPLAARVDVRDLPSGAALKGAP
jgi:transposase